MMKRLASPVLLAFALLLTHPIVGVAASEVADAVMQGDAARLETLLKAHEGARSPQSASLSCARATERALLP